MLIAALPSVFLSTLVVAAPPRPALVLLVSVDQLRAEDLSTFAPLLGPGGFGGVQARGVTLTGRYLTSNTETGPGHATLATGAYADEHGVVGNLMLTPEGKVAPAVEDVSAPLWGNPDPKSGKSPRVLRVPTVGDALKVWSGGRARVVSITGKDRSAILMGGHGADLVLWWDPGTARFVSSGYYGAEPEWVRAFNATHPGVVGDAYVWDTALPRARYQGLTAADERAGESPRQDLGITLPKRVAASHPKVGQALRFTPRVDELTLDMVREALAHVELGKDDVPDVLFVGLSSHDMAGHAYGPGSLERADVLVRASNGLRALVADLEKQVGKDRLAVVVTGDHGVTPLAEEVLGMRIPAGRASMDAARNAVDRTLDALVAPRDWVLGISPPNLWIRTDGAQPTCADMEAAAAEVARVPGVGRAVAACRLPTYSASVFVPLQHAHDLRRGGHVLLEVAPYWTWEDPDVTLGADHGSSALTDQTVPVVVMAPGFGVRADAQLDPVDMRRVAPTLSRLLGAPPPPAGRQSPLVQ